MVSNSSADWHLTFSRRSSDRSAVVSEKEKEVERWLNQLAPIKAKENKKSKKEKDDSDDWLQFKVIRSDHQSDGCATGIDSIVQQQQPMQIRLPWKKQCHQGQRDGEWQTVGGHLLLFLRHCLHQFLWPPDTQRRWDDHWWALASVGTKNKLWKRVTEKEEREKTKSSTDNNWSRGQRTHREQSWGQRVAVVVERSEA